MTSTNREKIWSCNICNKKYIRKNAFDKHYLLCKLENDNKIIKSSELKSLDSNLDTCNFNISNQKLYLLIIDLSNKYNKLQTDYDELKKYVVQKKKKLNIIEYLNENCIIDYITFDDLINNIIFNKLDNNNIVLTNNRDKNNVDLTNGRDYNNIYLNYVFENNFINGIVKIICELIISLREKKKIGVKVFHQKDEMYIYIDKTSEFNQILDEECDKEFDKKWIIIDYANFKKFIIKIHKKLINLFSIWQKSVEYKIKDEHFNNIYIENMKKILGQSKVGCGSHGDIYLTIKHKLQKALSENIKNIISLEFE